MATAWLTATRCERSTNPLDKNDVFAVVNTAAGGALPQVQWTVKASKTYQVMKSFDLRSWVNAPSGGEANQQSLRMAAANGLLDYVDPENVTSEAGKVFSRVRLVE